MSSCVLKNTLSNLHQIKPCELFIKLTPFFREGITARSIPPENLPEGLAFNFLGELTEIISKPGISKAS